MAAAIDSAKAEHSPLASASADPTSRQRSPSPCAATWSLPFRHSSPASPSAVLLVLPDGSARLYTEELTVAQLACDFPDLIVSCTVIVAGEMCEGRACDGCDSRAQDKELKPQGAILPPQTVLRLGGTYYLSNRDGLSFGAAASETVGDWRSSSRGSSSSYNSSCNIEDIRSREIYCTSGASISSSVEGSSVAGGSWRTFSSNDDIMCNGSDVGSSYSGNLSAVVSAANESKRFSSDGVVRSSHIRSLSLVFANPQISSPRQDLPCSGNQQVRRPLTPTISRSNDPSAAPSHVQPAQRPPATSSSVAHRRQFLRTTTPMRDRPVAPRHARSRTEIFGDAPILADSLVGDAPIAGWPVTTSAEWASLEHTLRQNKLQLQRSQLQQSQLQPSQQHQRAAHRRRNLSATAAVSPAGWLRADPSPYPSASASASASALPRDHMRSLSLARARLAEYAAGGGAAGGGVGVSAVDQPVGACHVAVPAGRALRRCYSHTETGTGGGRVVWWGGEAEQAERQGGEEAEEGEACNGKGTTGTDNIPQLKPDYLGGDRVVSSGDCNEGDTNCSPDSPSSTTSADSADSEGEAKEAFWDSPRCFFSPLSLSLPRSPFSPSLPAPLLSLTTTPTTKSAESPTTVTSVTVNSNITSPVTVSSRPGHARRRTMDLCMPLPSLSPATVSATASARKGSFSAAQSPNTTPSVSAGNTGGAAARVCSPSPLKASFGDGMRSAGTLAQESAQGGSSSRTRALLKSMSSRERQRSRESLPGSNLSGTSSSCVEPKPECIAGRNPSPLPWVHARANSLWNSLPQPFSAPLDASWKDQEVTASSGSSTSSISSSCGSTSSSSRASSGSSSGSSSSRRFGLLNFKALSISILSSSSSSKSCTNSPHSPFSPSPSSESPMPTAGSLSSSSSFDSPLVASFSPSSSSSSSPASSTSSPSSCFSPTLLSSLHSPSLPPPSHISSTQLAHKQPAPGLLPSSLQPPSLLSPSQLLPPLEHPSSGCASPISHLGAARPNSPHCSSPSPLPPLAGGGGFPGHVGRAPVSPHSHGKGAGKVVRASRFQKQEGEG